MIYVIESGDYFKVGYTANIKNRMSSYATHSPSFSLIRCEDGGKKDESTLHKKLSQHHYKGEWYNKFDGWLPVINSYMDSLRGSKEKLTKAGRHKDLATILRIPSVVETVVLDRHLSRLVGKNTLTRDEFNVYSPEFYHLGLKTTHTDGDSIAYVAKMTWDELEELTAPQI